ncbi:MAG: hypothetical protein H6696_11770 [Deferribacteres bacterium]|nr:hypothetical protein [candidate division KSB1 bacterium]MCB9502608.1 hypothetical protein [Deferribacteres bacterium]
MKQFILIISVCMIFLSTACSKDSDSATGPEPVNNKPIIVIDNPQENKPVVAFTFSEMQVNVFGASCAMSGCHNGTSRQGGLNLTKSSAYTSLVNAESSSNPGMMRVVPGSSANSLLIAKLNGSGTSQMPPNGALPQETIEKIKAWIDDGAPNN